MYSINVLGAFTPQIPDADSFDEKLVTGRGDICVVANAIDNLFLVVGHQLWSSNTTSTVL